MRVEIFPWSQGKELDLIYFDFSFQEHMWKSGQYHTFSDTKWTIKFSDHFSNFYRFSFSSNYA